MSRARDGRSADNRRAGANRRSDAADQSRLRPIEREPRPALVELASAILIVGGILSSVASIFVLTRMSEQGADPGIVGFISLALGVLGIVLGLLTRTGRAWLVTVNVAAVMGFLELVSFTPAGLLLGASDVFVVIALLANRPWFYPDEGDGGAGPEESAGA